MRTLTLTFWALGLILGQFGAALGQDQGPNGCDADERARTQGPACSNGVHTPPTHAPCESGVAPTEARRGPISDDDLDRYLLERFPELRELREEETRLREELEHADREPSGGNSIVHRAHCCCPDATEAFARALRRIQWRVRRHRVTDLSFAERVEFMRLNGGQMDFSYRAMVVGTGAAVTCEPGICPSYRVTLNGLHIRDHNLNDILYGFTGTLLGLSEEFLCVAGDLVNLRRHGTRDPEDTRAAYRIGAELAVLVTQGQEWATAESLEAALATYGPEIAAEGCDQHCGLVPRRPPLVRDFSRQGIWLFPGGGQRVFMDPGEEWDPAEADEQGGSTSHRSR